MDKIIKIEPSPLFPLFLLKKKIAFELDMGYIILNLFKENAA
jgi:hypothetical protein